MYWNGFDFFLLMCPRVGFEEMVLTMSGMDRVISSSLTAHVILYIYIDNRGCSNQLICTLTNLIGFKS